MQDKEYAQRLKLLQTEFAHRKKALDLYYARENKLAHIGDTVLGLNQREYTVVDIQLSLPDLSKPCTGYRYVLKSTALGEPNAVVTHSKFKTKFKLLRGCQQ